jgi:hypothetical protein
LTQDCSDFATSHVFRLGGLYGIHRFCACCTKEKSCDVPGKGVVTRENFKQPRSDINGLASVNIILFVQFNSYYLLLQERFDKSSTNYATNLN